MLLSPCTLPYPLQCLLSEAYFPSLATKAILFFVLYRPFPFFIALCLFKRSLQSCLQTPYLADSIIPTVLYNKIWTDNFIYKNRKINILHHKWLFSFTILFVLGTTSSLSGHMIVSMPKSSCLWRTTSLEWLCLPTSLHLWRRRMETMCPLKNWRSWPYNEEKNLVAFLFSHTRMVTPWLHTGDCYSVDYLTSKNNWLYQ